MHLLDELALKYGTDKGPLEHNYTPYYHMLLGNRRDTATSILEIGVFKGASLLMWADYFPSAKIHGIDISLPPELKHPRVLLHKINQSNKADIVKFAEKYAPFDLIVDDGSHMSEHQVCCLEWLFPFLGNKGIYVIEDLETSHMKHYTKNAKISCVDYLKIQIDSITKSSKHEYGFVMFAPKIVFIGN